MITERMMGDEDKPGSPYYEEKTYDDTVNVEVTFQIRGLPIKVNELAGVMSGYKMAKRMAIKRALAEIADENGWTVEDFYRLDD